jgi:RNA polymerase sigma factor (sigma-70 family)
VDVDEFAQRIGILLWKGNYRVLRSFRRESSLETWLFTIAKRNILRWLRETNWMESLEDKPQGSFIVQQEQEERLLVDERRKILQAASRKLSGRKQRLLGLWRQEKSRREIAEEMGLKRKSVTVEKVELVKMLQRVVRENCAI